MCVPTSWSQSTTRCCYCSRAQTDLFTDATCIVWLHNVWVECDNPKTMRTPDISCTWRLVLPSGLASLLLDSWANHKLAWINLSLNREFSLAQQSISAQSYSSTDLIIAWVSSIYIHTSPVKYSKTSHHSEIPPLNGESIDCRQATPACITDSA